MKALLRPTAPRVVAWALGIVALVSPVLLLATSDEPDMLAVMLWLLVPTTVAGFVLAWPVTDLPDPLAPQTSRLAQRWQARAEGTMFHAVVVAAILFIGTLVLQLVVSIRDGDWDEFFVGPLLVAALGAAPVFLAMLLSLLVIAPLRMLGSTLAAWISGGRLDSSRPAVAVLLLLLIPIGVVTVAAGYTVPDGTSTYRNAGAGLILIFQLMFTVQGTAEQQVFAWIARLLFVLLALDLVWIVRIARRRRNAGQS